MQELFKTIPDVETRPFCYLSVNQLIYLHYMTVTLESNKIHLHTIGEERKRKKHLQQRYDSEVDSTLEPQVLGFSVQYKNISFPPLIRKLPYGKILKI